MSPVITWTIVCVICFIMEFITAGEMVTVWFALGALVTCVLSGLGLDLTWQIIIFLSVSAISMILVRPICIKALKNSEGKTDLDNIKNAKVKIIEPVLQDKMGTVKLNGIVWNCVSVDNQEIASGTNCEVVKIQGNTLIVKAIY